MATIVSQRAPIIWKRQTPLTYHVSKNTSTGKKTSGAHTRSPNAGLKMLQETQTTFFPVTALVSKSCNSCTGRRSAFGSPSRLACCGQLAKSQHRNSTKSAKPASWPWCPSKMLAAPQPPVHSQTGAFALRPDIQAENHVALLPFSGAVPNQDLKANYKSLAIARYCALQR